MAPLYDVQHQTCKPHRHPTCKYLHCTNEFPNICISLMSKVLLKSNDVTSYLFYSVHCYRFSVPWSYTIVMHLGTIIFVPQTLSKMEPFANLPVMSHRSTVTVFYHQCYLFISKFILAKDQKPAIVVTPSIIPWAKLIHDLILMTLVDSVQRQM